MKLSDPFPIQNFPNPVRESIKAEFRGRCPSVREVLSLPDHHWLKLPGIGPATLLKMYRAMHLMEGFDGRSVTQWSDNELQHEYSFLSSRHGALQRESQALRLKLRLIEKELRLRGFDLQQSGSDQILASSRSVRSLETPDGL